jgi:predicted nucleotidyltransferase component of viral defense system
MSQELYKKQVGLLVEILPVLNEFNKVFILKGGTAINLFHSNMPRLSVDIDLAYIKPNNREKAYADINKNLIKMKAMISDLGFKVDVKDSDSVLKLMVMSRQTGAEIKIEPNYVMRTALYPNLTMCLCRNAVSNFNMEYEIRTLSKADLYAGKIAAALSRRHPRDLFDVKQFIMQGDFNLELLNAVVVYLSSNSRPIHELLNPQPNLTNLELAYENQFRGMTLHNECTVNELKETYMQLLGILQAGLQDNHRKFIMSVVSNKINYSLLDGVNERTLQNFSGLSKLLNIAKLQQINITAFNSQVQNTADILGLEFIDALYFNS